MPTYDYRCSHCAHEWELFQSIKANPIRKCPACGKRTAKRVIGPGAGVIFKGSGFYQTDYRSDAYRKRAEADRKAQDASGGESKSEGKKSDGKAAASESGGSKSSSGGAAKE